MEKENQRVIITKKLLKESLLNILRKKNISEVTVTELCKASGINRATFYRHYDVPGDVLLDIEKELSGNIVFETVPQTVDDFENYILMVCEYIYTNKDFITVSLKMILPTVVSILSPFSSRTMILSWSLITPTSNAEIASWKLKK